MTRHLTRLPGTWAELTAFLAHAGGLSPSSRARQVAELLEVHDVIDECGVCGADLVKAAAFASAAVAHYGLEGDEARRATVALEELVRASGVEMGAGRDPACARHAGDTPAA